MPRTALDRIRREVLAAKVSPRDLDLAALDSVAAPGGDVGPYGCMTVRP